MSFRFRSALLIVLTLSLAGCGDHGVKAAGAVYASFLDACSAAHTPRELVDAAIPFLAVPEAAAWKSGLSKMPLTVQTRPLSRRYSFSGVALSGQGSGSNVTLQTMDGEGAKVELINEGGSWKVLEPLFDCTGQVSAQTWKRSPALAASLTVAVANVPMLQEHLRADPALAKVKLAPLECSLLYEAVTDSSQLSEAERLPVVKLLLAQGVPVDAPDDFGKTPLEEGIGFLKIDRLLLAKGADVNHAEQSGRTPLYFACQLNESDQHPVEVVKLLVEHGAKVNALDKDGDSPLLKAVDGELIPGDADKVRANSLELVTYLVAHGADVNVKNKHGKTPLSLARETRLAASEKFLLAHGAK